MLICMKLSPSLLSAADWDHLVCEAGLNAAAESVARSLPVTGLLNGEMVTCAADDPRLAPLQSRVELAVEGLKAKAKG